MTPPVLASDFNIAVIDMQKAIHATKDGAKAKKELMKEYKFMEETLKKKEFGLKEKIENFEKKALLLSEKKRSEQQKEIQKLSMELQQKSQQFQFDIQKKQKEATAPIIAKLQKQIKILADKKGFDIILNKTTDNVLWTKKGIDITRTIVGMYEKNS
jgi:outer membrane protein